MSVKINIPVGQIRAKVETAFEKGLPLLTAMVRDDCNQYCKEDTGMLIASSMVHSRLDQGQIIWQTPYARRQYWEIQTAHTDTNPNATWKWAHVAKQHCADKWQRQAQALMEANL
jgi:hypothetical protein